MAVDKYIINNKVLGQIDARITSICVWVEGNLSNDTKFFLMIKRNINDNIVTNIVPDV